MLDSGEKGEEKGGSMMTYANMYLLNLSFHHSVASNFTLSVT